MKRFWCQDSKNTYASISAFHLANLTDGGTQIIPEHGLFDSEESGNKVLEMLPQGLDDVKQRVRQTWAKEKDQKPVWKWHVVRRIP